jgi:membrane-bound metal-dependent hydrolase YbcI (DUF457 family)
MWLDIAVGIFLATLLSKRANINPGWQFSLLILFGITGALLPDLVSFPLRMFSKTLKRIVQEARGGIRHRDFTHVPSLALPLSFFVG